MDCWESSLNNIGDIYRTTGPKSAYKYGSYLQQKNPIYSWKNTHNNTKERKNFARESD
jgi:lysine/ornithine N-monooxygenase